ncbi:MAG: calcium/sodium antiporter [Nitrosopumilus sp.]|nr:calcium/sodium antiporter [Nitrosopumilus sp.]
MEILIETIFMSLGLVMLYFGAEWLVRGSVAIANKLKINQLVIGLTIVAFGTSTPEMAVNVSSAIQGISDVALGNVVGSNIVNIGLILGIAAIIRPIAVAKNVVRKEIPILVGVSFLLLFLSIDQSLSSTDGIILVVGIVMFTIFSYKTSKKETHIESDTDLQIVTKTLVPKAIALIGVGLGLLTIGSFVTVENAVNLAQEFGISERTIGLTLVAVGTSLPELITSVIAAKKGHADLSVGNIIGSNIFNILAILGVSSVITGIAVSDAIWTDYYVMIGFALVLIPIMRTGFIISRIEGIILLIGYVVYSVFLFVK